MSPQTGTYNNSALSVVSNKGTGPVLTLSDGKTFSLDRQQSAALSVGLLSNGRAGESSATSEPYNWLFLFRHEGLFFRRLASCPRKRAKTKNKHVKRMGRNFARINKTGIFHFDPTKNLIERNTLCKHDCKVLLSKTLLAFSLIAFLLLISLPQLNEITICLSNKTK